LKSPNLTPHSYSTLITTPRLSLQYMLRYKMSTILCSSSHQEVNLFLPADSGWAHDQQNMIDIPPRHEEAFQLEPYPVPLKQTQTSC
jgi:hypothetical protein